MLFNHQSTLYRRNLMTPKALKITLAASLAVNLLFIGGSLATMKCRHDARHLFRKSAEIHRMHDRGIPDMNRERPDRQFGEHGDRKDFRGKQAGDKRMDHPEMKKFHEEMRAEREKLEKALKMEPFNETEVRKVLKEINQQREAAMEKRTDKMIEEAKKLSPEERVRLFSFGKEGKQGHKEPRPMSKPKR